MKCAVFVPDRLYVCVKLLFLISFLNTSEGKTHQESMMYVYDIHTSLTSLYIILYLQNELATSRARESFHPQWLLETSCSFSRFSLHTTTKRNDVMMSE